jgi:N-acyl-D-aspartate/D-glutamate deacylase
MRFFDGSSAPGVLSHLGICDGKLLRVSTTARGGAGIYRHAHPFRRRVSNRASMVAKSVGELAKARNEHPTDLFLNC